MRSIYAYLNVRFRPIQYLFVAIPIGFKLITLPPCGGSSRTVKPMQTNALRDTCDYIIFTPQEDGQYEDKLLRMTFTGRVEISLLEDKEQFTITPLDQNKNKLSTSKTKRIVLYHEDNEGRIDHIILDAYKNEQFFIRVQRLKGSSPSCCLRYRFVPVRSTRETAGKIPLLGSCNRKVHAEVTDAISTSDSVNWWTFALPELSSFEVTFKPERYEAALKAELIYNKNTIGEESVWLEPNQPKLIRDKFTSTFFIKIYANDRLEAEESYSLHISRKGCPPVVWPLQPDSNKLVSQFSDGENEIWFRYETSDYKLGGRLVVNVSDNSDWQGLDIPIHTYDREIPVNPNTRLEQGKMEFPVASNTTYYLRLYNISARKRSFAIEVDYLPEETLTLLEIIKKATGENLVLKDSMMILESQIDEMKANQKRISNSHIFKIVYNAVRELNTNSKTFPSQTIEECLKWAVKLAPDNQNVFFEYGSYYGRCFASTKDEQYRSKAIGWYKNCKDAGVAKVAKVAIEALEREKGK